MATLTETAYLTRKIIKYGGIAFVAFLILRFVWMASYAYYRQINPPPPPPPTTLFGRLPKISFPENKNLPEMTYTLETIQGTLPKMETIGKVYVSIKPSARLLSLDKAKETAKRIGFSTAPQPLSESTYRFTTQTTPTTTLDYNIIDGSFKYLYDFPSDQGIFTEKKLPSNEQAVSEARSFLQAAGLLEDDLKTGNFKIAYFRFQAPDLIPAISLSEADLVSVSLWREDLDGLPIKEENPDNPYVTFLISGSRAREKRMVAIDFRYNLIDRERFSTYPLKPVTTAWEELKSGNGFVASLGENKDGKVTIRKVSLAYYDSRQPQNYLQPIFVFEGDKNFVGYVPAVDPKWTE